MPTERLAEGREGDNCGSGRRSRAITHINAARQDFFADVLTKVVAARTDSRMPRRGRASCIPLASGPFGYWSISFDRSNRCKVKACLDMTDKSLNKALLVEMVTDAEP